MNARIQPDTISTFTLEFDARVREQILATAAQLLRAHPDATLGDLVDPPGAAGLVLRSLTLAELLALGADEKAERLATAGKLQGRDFDAMVLRELAEHEQRLAEAGIRYYIGMSRAQLVERVGGPRWKIQAAMRRLVGVGKVTRSGITSGTRYILAPLREVGPR
jgi:hypothetical protein